VFIKEAIQVILVWLLIEGLPLGIQPGFVVLNAKFTEVRLRENQFKEDGFMVRVKGRGNLGDLLGEKQFYFLSFGFGNPVVLFLLVAVHKLLTPVFSKLS
jgi:hypothetical protein